MASHLTVISKSPTGPSAPKAFGAHTGAETDNGGTDSFAALLGEAGQAVSAPAAGKKADSSLNKIVGLLQGSGKSEGEAADPEAVAALIDAAQPIQDNEEAKALLTDLVNGLASLNQALEAGENIDPELIDQIGTAFDGLAEALDLDLSTMPDLAALTALSLDQTDAAAQLTNALAPLAQALLGKDAAPAAGAELSAKLNSIGEKLAALLHALNNEGLSAEKLAALGLDKNASFDADLEAAIAKLLSAAPKVDPTAQTLATPALKLTEPTLTGKGQPDPSADGDTELKPLSIVSEQTGRETGKGDGDKPADDKKPSIAIAANAPADARAEAQATSAAPAATPAARVDASAPRVIQAGYQTSQQQLNLPQLAFELVRQVTGGNTRFQMRLDPAELGRIDVRLDIDKSGQVNARLMVEKSETLDLMQRDQRALERALQQAGLDSSRTNLEFSLKQNPFSGNQQQGRDGQGQQFSLDDMGADDIEQAAPTINLYRASLTASGVNIIA